MRFPGRKLKFSLDKHKTKPGIKLYAGIYVYNIQKRKLPYYRLRFCLTPVLMPLPDGNGVGFPGLFFLITG